MATKKLNQVIAIEKGTKSRLNTEITELHKQAQKPELYYGFNRTYVPRDAEGEQFPPESKKVQLRAEDVLEATKKAFTEILNITATKDFANTTAKANVAIGEQVLIQDVPVPYLLFLEKELTDLRTFITKMPALDESEDWQDRDSATGLFKTPVVQKHRTAKKVKPIVKYDATKEHPAQTELITQDEVVGFWHETKLSGAITRADRRQLLERTQKVLDAVKVAREEANGAEAPDKAIGEDLLSYIFA